MRWLVYGQVHPSVGPNPVVAKHTVSFPVYVLEPYSSSPFCTLIIVVPVRLLV